MIYGPHCSIYFHYLKPKLIHHIKELKKETEHIHSILEFSGPTNEDFDNYVKLFGGKKKETIFDIIKMGMKQALLKYVQEGVSIYNHKKFGINLNFELPLFMCNIIDSSRLYGIKFRLEDCNYQNWLKIKNFLPNGSFKGNEKERKIHYIKNLSAAEKTFRKQVIEIVKKEAEASFIIVRGDWHMGKYYTKIRNDFASDCKVIKDTYGILDI